MATAEKTNITVEAIIDAPVEKVWKFWTSPEHITKWNQASDDWHTPRAENDLRVGGKFLSRMEAKDGSTGFDFEGEYKEVKEHELIVYKIADDREVEITFRNQDGKTIVTERFEADSSHSSEMQQQGWQAILNNFKNYVESAGKKEKLYFTKEINASAERVYNAMLDEESYRKWTAPFNPSSHYIGSWEKGSKILFIGTDEKGVKGGMVSRIKENIPYKFVSIEHIGFVQNDEEVTSGPEIEKWAGALENYIYEERNGSTLLTVELDSIEEFESFFTEIYPMALDVLKEICEVD